MSRRGTTLLELIIVIIVIGTLSAIVYPSFTRTAESARGKEAKLGIELIIAAEEMILLKTGEYQDCNSAVLCGATNSTSCNDELDLNLSDENWEYTVCADNLATPPVFFAIATRKDGPFINQQIIWLSSWAMWGGSWSLPWW